jgi:hypothetical protein
MTAQKLHRAFGPEVAKMHETTCFTVCLGRDSNPHGVAPGGF